MIRRYLLARSTDFFSWVEIGALHSGKGYRGIKEEKKKKKKEKKRIMEHRDMVASVHV